MVCKDEAVYESGGALAAGEVPLVFKTPAEAVRYTRLSAQASDARREAKALRSAGSADDDVAAAEKRASDREEEAKTLGKAPAEKRNAMLKAFAERKEAAEKKKAAARAEEKKKAAAAAAAAGATKKPPTSGQDREDK